MRWNTRLAKTVGVAAAMLLIAAPAAVAGPITHLTINGISSPSGAVPFDGVSDGLIAFETDYGVPISCNPASLSGKAYRGALIAATNPIGRITRLGDNCTATTLGLPIVFQQATDWDIVVKTAPSAAGDPIDVSIMDMSLYAYSSVGSCEFQLTASAGVDATFYPGSTPSGHDGRLEIDTNGVYSFAVTAYDGSGTLTPTSGGTCGGEIYGSDVAKVAGAFDLDTSGPAAGLISHG